MKKSLMFASLLGAFALTTVTAPARADDKAPGAEKGDKAEKGKKKGGDKAEKKGEDTKQEKKGGGW